MQKLKEIKFQNKEETKNGRKQINRWLPSNWYQTNN